MVRTEGDSWDLASSVGATATMVAAGRAIASAAENPLIDDPYAAPLVRAVGIPAFTMMVDGSVDLAEIAPESAAQVRSNIDEMAVRTKFFDDYFMAAGESGVRQAVILAAGLDARAYRLPWADGTTVYEVDQPAVIEFKTRTLADLGATPTAERRTVPVDLRDDWPTAMRAAGLDPDQPIAWCAEGLLIYLPPDAQDRLFDNIHALSAPGSTVATEFVPGMKDFDPEKARAAAATFSKLGLEMDMPSLVYRGERTSAADYLRPRGWQMTQTPRADLFTSYGLGKPDLGAADVLGEIIYISGRLS